MKTLLKLLFPVILLVFSICSCKKDTEEKPDPNPNPNPSLLEVNLGNDTTILEGTSIILDAGNPGANFLWSTGATTQTISIDTTGHYSVKVVKDNIEGKDTIWVQIQFNTIKIETNYGDFRIWLYHSTPQHRNNFINLANQNFYDSLIFHRVVENFVIQGGDPEGTGYGGPGYNLPAEIVSGLNHVYGAVGAARLPDNINPNRESNGSQFYIVSDPNGEPFLNANYTVFGLVFNGITIVDAISHVPVDSNDKPLQNVYMKKVKVEKYTAEQLMNNFGFTVPQ